MEIQLELFEFQLLLKQFHNTFPEPSLITDYFLLVIDPEAYLLLNFN